MQINIETMLLLFLLGAGVAMLETAFQFMQQDGQIFMKYRTMLMYFVKKATEIAKKKDYFSNCRGWVYKSGKQPWYILMMAYLAKPLGICPYCNGTWLAIAAFILIFGLNLIIFILIGITFFFIRLLTEFKFNKYAED